MELWGSTMLGDAAHPLCPSELIPFSFGGNNVGA